MSDQAVTPQEAAEALLLWDSADPEHDAWATVCERNRSNTVWPTV